MSTRRLFSKRSRFSHKKCFKKYKRKDVKKRGKYKKKHSNRKIYYKKKDNSTVILGSSWEVKVAESLDKNNISWTRPLPLPWIDKENKAHKYYPDFYLPDFDVYLEPKNDYLRKKDADKIFRVRIQNDVVIKVLNKDQLIWRVIKRLIKGH